MGDIAVDEEPTTLDVETVNALASEAGLRLNPAHVKDWASIIGRFDDSVGKVLSQTDHALVPDLEQYPRTGIHIPRTSEESDSGGWATTFISQAISPKTSLLQHKTVALKDNIAFAGVRCTNGTTINAWTPTVDATIATRVLDAGATISGKAACENSCLDIDSDTSCTGPVHNFSARGYSCGGSSSGSARLVASGAVDIALGTDQGGSIRIPASMCGIVGLKPTFGLVPYSGCLSLEATLDHAGPMARNVRDCAVLLEVIAGADGFDDRQPSNLTKISYTQGLNNFLGSPSSKPLTGMKLGVLGEGFNLDGMHASVSSLAHSAILVLESLGATIRHVSVPEHTSAAEILLTTLTPSSAPAALLGAATGRKQFRFSDREPLTRLTQQQFDVLGPGAQNLYLRYLYLQSSHEGAKLYAKGSNILRKINDAYDSALATVDVLVMPTLPCPAPKLLPGTAFHGPLERMSRCTNVLANVAPFNGTGHPALSIPMGFVPAAEDSNVKLPAGLQLVAKKFCEMDCLKVGSAWESTVDWRTLSAEN